MLMVAGQDRVSGRQSLVDASSSAPSVFISAIEGRFLAVPSLR